MENTCLDWLKKTVEYCEQASQAFSAGKRSHCRQFIRAGIHALGEANWSADLNALLAEDTPPLPLGEVKAEIVPEKGKRKRKHEENAGPTE